MGRELKRVALDFQGPLNQVWEGYRNPHTQHCSPCRACQGDGTSPDLRALRRQWYGETPFRPEERGSTPFEPRHPVVWANAQRNVAQAPALYGGDLEAVAREARRLADHYNGAWRYHLNEQDVAALVAEDRLWDLTRSWLPGQGWQLKDPAVVPSPREVNEWSLTGLGHDSFNCWLVVSAEARRLGLPTNCSSCGGGGNLWRSEEDRLACEAWERTEPPAGEGYQIWETVSEGSPISPVFSQPEHLADWMATHSRGVDSGTTYAAWLAFIQGPGWAPSFVHDATGLHSGVRAVTKRGDA